MLHFDTNNSSWYWLTKDEKRTYVNYDSWSWHPGDPNVRKLFEHPDNLSQSWDHSPIVPILAVVVLAITVFLLVLFRQNPGLVAGTVAGLLVVVAIYLTLSTLQQHKAAYE